MYEARKICNFLLSQYSATAFDLTNLRLNKLLYFIHGWSLTRRPKGIVRNHFEAWKLGPVVKPVYDAFKKYGDGPITNPAEFVDYSSGLTVAIPFDEIVEVDRQLIVRVFDSYASYSTNQLVCLSHQPGGPWDTVLKGVEEGVRLSPRIPDVLIRQYFHGEIVGKVRH
jgi:uncharacterized phage-associated protein